MNWKLPDGRVVRIGERVVKSTTGYDLLRFLLLSDCRFGQPLDFVLRLRPDCGIHGIFSLSGDAESITRAMPALLQSCWMNWFDSVDVVVDGVARSLELRIAVNTPADEWPVFESMLTAFAATYRLSAKGQLNMAAPIDGCPDFVLKTTPDRALAMGRDIANEHRVKSVVLCYNGVVHVYVPGSDDIPAQVNGITKQVESQLHKVGGDWRSRHVPRSEAQGVAARWLQVLGKEFTST